jgi:hypothetical protein
MIMTRTAIISRREKGNEDFWLVDLADSCCSHLEHRISVKRFVSLQFLILRHSIGLIGRVISLSQGRYLTQTEWTQSDIHVSSGIRTHDPSDRTSEDRSCLRPRDRCARQRRLLLAPSKYENSQHRTSYWQWQKIYSAFSDRGNLAAA